MPIEQFSTATETIESIRWRIQSAHRKFEGAQVRVALARAESGAEFLTGTMMLAERKPENRETADYGQLRLSEFWINGTDATLDFLTRLFQGKGSVGGIPIPHLFNRSMAHRESSKHIASGWPSWVYEATPDSNSGKQRLHLEPIPTVAKGLPPFKSPSEAVANWMFEASRHGIVDGNVPHQDQFLVVIPDTRARFQSGQWSPGKLSLLVELNADPLSIELQVVHGGAKTRFANHPVQSGAMSLSVPEDSTNLALYLVHHSGDLLSDQILTHVYRSFGDRGLQEEPDDAHWQSELQKGENERREFKPFIAPMDGKELEIVKTAIAFANTDGGTIFAGVDNEGIPLGLSQARKCFKSEDPIAAQMARLKVLIGESTQPVPSTTYKIVNVSGQPIILVGIEKSEVLCSTHDNRAYIRKGATSRLADPRTELSSLIRTSSFDLWGNQPRSDLH